VNFAVRLHFCKHNLVYLNSLIKFKVMNILYVHKYLNATFLLIPLKLLDLKRLIIDLKLGVMLLVC